MLRLLQKFQEVLLNLIMPPINSSRLYDFFFFWLGLSSLSLVKFKSLIFRNKEINNIGRRLVARRGCEINTDKRAGG